jgi:tetratricopeptide (TPR) repeat protein
MSRLHVVAAACFLLLATAITLAQNSPTSSPDATASARKATTLAEQGHCDAAFSTLEKSIHVSDQELKRKVGLSGVRCSMTMGRPDAALRFLEMLSHSFPNDPEVLYSEIHAYSDLSTQTSQMLARTAPSSPQAHELLAESYESQGKWGEAEKEYRAIAAANPKLPGIHFRIGRLLLSGPNPPASAVAEARREFSEELAIDPSNAAAEYVLGELARQDQSWDAAIAHFSKASKLDPQFSEAFLGLGICYIAQKRYTDAVPPLETAVKLEPRNPDAHYQLATAYTRAGRKDEGQKEFVIHQRLIGTQGGEHPESNTKPPDAQK